MRRIVKMYPALLRVGFAAALAYRAEFLVWVLTTNLPLINLALFSAVARETGPIGGYGQPQLTAYYLTTLIVRQLTGSYVVWEMTQEIKQGTMAMRLLRPVHPLFLYGADNLGVMPMRFAVCLPIAMVLVGVTGTKPLAHDALAWVCVPLFILGAWFINFLVSSLVGTLAFFFESAASVYSLWLGLYTVFSGYLVPLDLFPPWLRAFGSFLPFRLLIALPVETMLGKLSHAQLGEALFAQVAWIAGLTVVVHFAWKAGMRRYVSFGG